MLGKRGRWAVVVAAVLSLNVVAAAGTPAQALGCWFPVTCTPPRPHTNQLGVWAVGTSSTVEDGQTVTVDVVSLAACRPAGTATGPACGYLSALVRYYPVGNAYWTELSQQLNSTQAGTATFFVPAGAHDVSVGGSQMQCGIGVDATCTTQFSWTSVLVG